MNTSISYPYKTSVRNYRFLKPASIDNYIWVEFQDEPGKEVMIFDTNNILPTQDFTNATNYLKEKYGLNPNDIDLTEDRIFSIIEGGETVQEYIDHLAGKYGLTPREKMTLQQAKTIINKFS